MQREYIGRGVPASDLDWQAVAADAFGGDVAIIKGIWKTEAPRGAFYRLPEGLAPTTLYEGHIAYREAGSYRTKLVSLGLAWQRWGAVKYGSYAQQYDRIDRANAAAPGVGYVASSWGGPQILGKNAVTVGYRNARDMALAFADSEVNQLKAVAAFCKKTIVRGKSIARWAIEGRYDMVALGYNGAGYKTHNYHGRLQANVEMYRRSGAAPAVVAKPPAKPDETVREGQDLLTRLGFDPGPIDGWYGDKTKTAVKEFQKGHPGLHIDGQLGGETLAALRKAVEAKKAQPVNDTGAGAVVVLGGGAAAQGAQSGWPVWAWVAVSAVALIAAFLIWRQFRKTYAAEIEAKKNNATGVVLPVEPVAERVGEHFTILGAAQ